MRDERGHDSKKILQRRMMNQRFTFTLPARYCSSKISRFQSFIFLPVASPVSPCICSARDGGDGGDRSGGIVSRKPAPVAAPPPSLPSPRPPAPPPRRLTPRCRPQQPAAALRADGSVAAAFAGYGLRHWRRWSAWHCSTRSRPQPRGRQLALRLAGSADAAQGLLGAAAPAPPMASTC